MSRSATHRDHTTFIDAIHAKRRLSVRFFSDQDGERVTRKCAPFDHASSRSAHDPVLRYHFHDFTSPDGPHTLSLRREKILSMTALVETFEPAEIVRWSTREHRWTVPRDWGAQS